MASGIRGEEDEAGRAALAHGERTTSFGELVHSDNDSPGHAVDALHSQWW